MNEGAPKPREVGPSEVSKEDAASLLERSGVEFDALESPDGGYSKRIFRILHEGVVTYVRFGSSESIEAHMLLHEVLQLHGVPTPQILESGYDDVLRTGFLIQGEAMGKSLSSFRRDTEEHRLPLPDAGRVLHVIHHITLEGYGLLRQADNTLQGKYATWGEYIRKRKPNLSYLHEEGIIDESAMVDFEESFARLINSEPAQGSLLHNDYHPEHLFTDGESITSIIDWELAAVGDPCEELAIAKYFLDSERFELLMNGYGDVDLSRLHDYLFLTHLRKLQWASENRISNFESKKAGFKKFREG